MQGTPHYFIKNAKECKERRVLLQRMQKNARMLRSFEKNACPTLAKHELSQHYAKLM